MTVTETSPIHINSVFYILASVKNPTTGWSIRDVSLVVQDADTIESESFFFAMYKNYKGLVSPLARLCD